MLNWSTEKFCTMSFYLFVAPVCRFVDGIILSCWWKLKTAWSWWSWCLSHSLTPTGSRRSSSSCRDRKSLLKSIKEKLPPSLTCPTKPLMIGSHLLSSSSGHVSPPSSYSPLPNMNKLHGHSGLSKQSPVNPLLGQQLQQHPNAPSSMPHMGRCLLLVQPCSLWPLVHLCTTRQPR